MRLSVLLVLKRLSDEGDQTYLCDAMRALQNANADCRLESTEDVLLVAIVTKPVAEDGQQHQSCVNNYHSDRSGLQPNVVKHENMFWIF